MANLRRRKFSKWLANGIDPVCLVVLAVLIVLVVAALWRALQMVS